MSIITAYKIGGQPVGTIVTSWSLSDLSGNDPFKIESATASVGYEDISSIVAWDNFGFEANALCSVIISEIKVFYDATTFNALSSIEKEICSRWFIATQTERDTVKTTFEQEQDDRFLIDCLKQEESTFLSSNTSIDQFISQSNLGVLYTRPISASFSTHLDNFTPTGIENCNILRLDNTSTQIRNISGLTAGVAGRMIIIMNYGDKTIKLLINSGLSDSQNRFRGVGSQNIQSGGSATIVYDGISNVWQVVAGLN